MRISSMFFKLLLCAGLCAALGGCGPVTSPDSISASPFLPASSGVPEGVGNELPWKTVQTVGAIAAPWSMGASALDIETARAYLEAQAPGVLFVSRETAGSDDMAEAAATLIEEGAEVLAASLPTAADAAALIKACKEAGVPLILAGAKPTAAAMQSYDKCWYIGTLNQQAGETLGTAAARDFWNGALPDLNGDQLLQMAWLGGDAGGAGALMRECALQSLADLGVFSDEEGSNDARYGEEAGRAMAQELLESGALPEAVLCADTATARGAASVLAGQVLYIACVAADKAEADALEAEGIRAPAWLGRVEVTQYAMQFAQNVLGGQHPTLDTGLYLDENRQTLVPCGSRAAQ